MASSSTIIDAYAYPYPMASLTADMVVLRDRGFGDFDVLMIERGEEPFKGRLAIPGGYAKADKETFLQAGIRELGEETGIDATKYAIISAGYADEPNRDPRGRVVSGIFYIVVPADTKCKADDDAVRCEWVPDEQFEDSSGKWDKNMFAFDHKDIVNRVLHTEKRRYVR